jgi:hypothetical protein
LLTIEPVKLLSTDGRELKITTENSDSERMHLSLSNYPPGIYYLTIRTKEGLLNKKVVITR